MLRPIAGRSPPRPLPAALPWPHGLFAISAGAACGRALRQTSALKREGGSHTEPEPGELSLASGCLVRTGWDLSAGRRQTGRPWHRAPCARPSGTRHPAAAQPWGPCRRALGDVVPQVPPGSWPGPGPFSPRSPGSAMSRLLPLLLLAALGCAAKPKRRPVAWDDGADGNPPPLGTPSLPGRGCRPWGPGRAGAPLPDPCPKAGGWQPPGAGRWGAGAGVLPGLLGVPPGPAHPLRSPQPRGHWPRAAPT